MAEHNRLRTVVGKHREGLRLVRDGDSRDQAVIAGERLRAKNSYAGQAVPSHSPLRSLAFSAHPSAHPASLAVAPRSVRAKEC